MKATYILTPLKPLLKKPAAILLPIALFFAGWWFASPSSETTSNREASSGAANEWTCSMHPQIRQPDPGLCPICNMDLIPLKAGSGSGALREVTISEDAAALLDIRVTPVVRAPASINIELFGKIDYDERSIVTTTARVGGRLERLYSNFTGTAVSKGDAIAEIYSPELYVAQEELIQAVVASREKTSPAVQKINESLLAAAREKLRLLQLTDKQIAGIEQRAEPNDTVTLTAPQSGIIVRLNAREGQYVKVGDPLFGIANLDSVWLKMEAYESELPWLRYAQKVSFTVEAIPGKTFTGRISFVDPHLDAHHRVVRVRVTVDNRGHLLKPGMFASAAVQAKVNLHGQVVSEELKGKWISPMHPEIIKDQPGSCDICGMALVPAEKYGFVGTPEAAEQPLLIPASALLRTGKRALVYVRHKDKKDPVFEGREIVLGPKTGNYFIVDRGLDEGELVVTKGAYKLDSELQIKARPSMMNPNAGLSEQSAKRPDDQLTGQWSPVLRAYGKFVHSISENRGEGALQHLANMQEALASIKDDQLQEADLALWRDFSMRLDNVLTQAETMDMDLSTLAMVRHQVEQTGRYVGLPWEPLPSVEADTHWIDGLRQSKDAYLAIAIALSDDNAADAKKAAPELIRAITTLPDDPSGQKLLKQAEQLRQDADIAAMRTSFKPVSDSLIALIRKHGLNHLGNVYVIHCPMAHGDKGADWISADTEVRNPYYGSAMYACGFVKDTLSLAPKTDVPAHSGDKHKHEHDH
ncbi:MAG: efflux RND transporter periplasmic adaptor subunit [Akkermansiaceae bacterium]